MDKIKQFIYFIPILVSLLFLIPQCSVLGKLEAGVNINSADQIQDPNTNKWTITEKTIAFPNLIDYLLPKFHKNNHLIDNTQSKIILIFFIMSRRKKNEKSNPINKNCLSIPLSVIEKKKSY